MKLTIGISYAPVNIPKYARYKQALETAAERAGYELETIELYEHADRAKETDGILFTGGDDISPARYGKEQERTLCGEIDEARDQSEFEIAQAADKLSLPVLGICRGAQLMNVYRGGTLVTDLEHFGGKPHAKIDPNTDRRHKVKVTPSTQVARVMRSLSGEINSAHHQAIERLGEGLSATAYAEEDGTVEAIEWAQPEGKPYFLAVQWHPERMDFDEAFSGPIFENFLWEVAAHKLLRHRIGDLKELADKRSAASNEVAGR